MRNVALEAQVEWKFFKDSASGYWIAVCEPLKQTVSGETWAEMNEAIAQTLELLFQELLQRDDLDAFLQSHGWKYVTDESRPTRRSRNVRFDVPWKLTQRRGAYDKEAALC